MPKETKNVGNVTLVVSHSVFGLSVCMCIYQNLNIFETIPEKIMIVTVGCKWFINVIKICFHTAFHFKMEVVQRI